MTRAMMDRAVPLVQIVREVMLLTSMPEDVMTLMMIQLIDLRRT